MSGRTPVLHDTTNSDEFFPKDKGRGLQLYHRGSSGYAGVANPFPDSLLIPRSEWQARIKEREEKKSRIRDLCDQAKLPPKDQDQTDFCWGNAPTYLTEVMRVIQNEPMVILSPASVCAPLTDFKNEGGWGKWALQRISDHGAVPVDHWPANAINRKYDTPANDEIAASYRVTEWWELEPQNVDQLVTCLLLGYPVAVGYDWWSHEVSGIDPVWIDGDIGLLIRNSWGSSWKDNGYAILQGKRMIPDDAVAPRVAVAA